MLVTLEDFTCGPYLELLQSYKRIIRLYVLCLEVGTSVASALAAETIFEIMKCMSDVDMRGRVRMGSKSEISMFFNSGYAHERNISIFRRRASTVTGNTLIEPISMLV